MLTITCDRYSNNVEVVSDKHGDITESMEIVKMKIDLSTCEPAMVTFTCLVDKTNIIIDDDNVNILKKGRKG